MVPLPPVWELLWDRLEKISIYCTVVMFEICGTSKYVKYNFLQFLYFTKTAHKKNKCKKGCSTEIITLTASNIKCL